MGFRCGLVFFPYRLVNFIAEHPHFARRIDAKTYLIAVDAHHGNNDVVTEGDAFTGTAAEYQQGLRLAEKIEQTRPEHLRRRFQGRIKGALESGKIGIGGEHVGVFDP